VKKTFGHLHRDMDNPEEVFQHGPWEKRKVKEAIEEARRLGRLPEGLEIWGDWEHIGGDRIVVAANNRTLYVAQEANLHNITVLGLDTNEGYAKVQHQYKLAKKKGGSGFPIVPDDITVRRADCGG
jgi:hypothetical protein